MLIFALQLGNTSHIISSNVFTGAQNTDLDPRLVKNTDFIDALNIRNGHGVEVGAVTNVKGTVNVANINLPTGTNKCVGSYEDRDNNSIIYFVWNSGNDHRIFRYFPTNTITEIARGAVLGFDKDRPIHSIKLIDNTYLYWTDARKSGQTLVGQAPKKINIKTSVIVGRKTRYELLFPSTDATSISIIQNDYDGANTVTLGSITPTTIAATITQLNAIAGVTVVDSTPNKIIIESATSKRLSLNLGTNFIGFAPLDSYTFPLQAQHISWAKTMPINRVTSLSTTGTAFSWNKTPQLCYRYLYRDGEYSAWSPFSYIPNPTDGNEFQDFDIIYSIKDSKLIDPTWLCMIKSVQVAVKAENFGILQEVDNLEISKLRFTSLAVSTDFNVGQSNYLPVASDDNTSTADAQTLKLYDRIPILSETMDMVADENGATRAFLGGNLHGYDNLLAVNSNFDAVSQWVDVNNDSLRKPISLRQGGQYRYGFVYYDEIGRQSAVQPAEKLLPIPSLDNGGHATWLQATPQISISHKAPTWAKKYQIVRTKELTAASWKVYEAELLAGGLEGGELTIGAPSVNQEAVVFWKLKGVAKNITSGVTTVIFDTNTALDNLVSKGDAIRAFSKVDTAITVGNLGGGVIRGYHIDSAGDFGVITDVWFNTGAAPTPCYAELYTPISESVTSQVYYETGMIFDVDSSGYHLGNPQNQTVSQPALIDFVGGDTVWSKVKIDISGTPTQVPIPYHLRNNEDIGRIAVVDPNQRQRYYWDEISFSGVYIPYAQQNSLSAFRPLDTQRVEQNYGAIRRLVHLRDTLLAVCEFKTQPIYISKDRVLSLNGSSQVGRTDRIMNIAQETVHDYGTMNPESGSYFDSRWHFFDLHNGITWRYAADGQTDTSIEGRHNYFNDVSQVRRLYNELDNRVISNIETRYKTVYFTFNSRSGSGIASFTEGYEDSETRGWKGRFSFTPEMYGRVGQVFVSFIEGELWIHDVSVVAACNFYGVQYDSKIEFIHNAEAQSIKTPYKIIEQASDIWAVEKAETYPTLSYPSAQLSKIPSTRFGIYEGKIEGEFLRNQIDPSQEFASITPTNAKEAAALLRGEYLKYDAMKIRLTKRNPQTLGKILKVDISFTKSENTI